MVSFTQPLFWQIRYLVAGLSKRSYKSSVAELHQLVSLYGYEAQIFLLRTLIEELQFQDAKHGGGAGRDQLKLQLLQSELREVENEELFGVALRQAVEASRDGITEEFASHLCKAAKLQLRAQFSFAVACLQSTNETSRREGAKFLKTKIRESSGGGLKNQKLPDSLLHSLLTAVRSPELEEVLEERDRDAFVKQLLDSLPELDGGPCAGLMRMQRGGFQRLAKQAKRIVIPEVQLLATGGDNTRAGTFGSDGVRACDLVAELSFGVAGSSETKEAICDVLALFPDIGTRGLGEVVCVALRASLNPSGSGFPASPSGAPSGDPHASLAAGILSATVRDKWTDTFPAAPPGDAGKIAANTTTHDIAGTVEVLKSCVPGARWGDIFELMFDLPELKIVDERSFQGLLAAHKAACGADLPYPLAAVLKRRRNTAAQLQFLRHASKTDAKTLSFASVPTLLEPVPGLPGASDGSEIGGQNHCWACTGFIEILLDLAEIEDYGVVRELFEVPLKATPEVLLLTLCSTEDRSRGALKADLLSQLVPPLFDPEAEHSTLVQTTLADRAPAQLRRLLRAMHERSPEKSVPLIMDILAKEQLADFYSGLIGGPPSELSCQLALEGSSRGTLSLATWVTDVLNEHKDAAALGFVRFLKVRLQPAPASVNGKEDGATPPWPAGTDETATYQTFLGALQEVLPTLSPEPARKVRELTQLAEQKYPDLAPAAAPPQPPAPTPAPPAVTSPAPPSAPPPGPSAPPAPSAPSVPAVPSLAAPAAPSGPGAPPPGAPPPAPPPPPQPLSAEELEEASNSYFSKIYTGEMSVPQLIEIMKEFASQPKGNWKHEVYSRMVQNLFDECRFFPKYPPQELTTTGELFGSLINNDLVHATNLGLALRCVLEALRRPMHTKMFRFGILALEQFLEKLPVWPQLCHHLTQVEHLAEAFPQYVEYAKNILKVLPPEIQHSTALKPEVLVNYQMPKAPPRFSQSTEAAANDSSTATPAAVAPLQPPPREPPPMATAMGGVKSAPPAGMPPAKPPPPPMPSLEGASTPPTAMPPPRPDASGAGTAVSAPPTAAAPKAPVASASSTAPSPSAPPPPPATKVATATTPAVQVQPKVANSTPATPAATTAAATATATAAASTTPATTTASTPAAAAAAAPTAGSALMIGGAQTVDSLLNDPELQIEKPPSWFQDGTAQIFNNLVKDNVEAKVEEMKAILQAEYHPWLAYYLVKNRASKEVNFHPIYIEFFEKFKDNRLLEMVTNMTYDCLRVLLKSVDQAVVSTSHRTVLKNLGYWLGQITLARNKPLKSKQMDLKSLLLDAFENGRLTAVLPLVCKVLEGVHKSKVYKPPNPWTTAIMSLLAEIHDVPNLRTNLMFEVEVLCKHLDIKISDLKRSELLVGKKPPPGSNDISSAARQGADTKAAPARSGSESTPATTANASTTTNSIPSGTSTGRASGELTSSTPSTGPQLRSDATPWSSSALGAESTSDGARASSSGSLSLGQGGYHGYGSGDSLLPVLPNSSTLGTASERTTSSQTSSSQANEFIISTLPSLVTVNPSIALFQMQPNLRALVPHAVNRAIKEVIPAVVERSVTISCLTTREMVTKDFAVEPDENVLKKAAQLMVSSVAGSLALVTCREPLRVSLTNHLWQLLMHCAKDMNDSSVLEHVVHMLSTENLELGCNLIEKAVVDKALKDIEESIAPAIQARKDHRLRNPNVPYYDTNYIQPNATWPQVLPDMLRPKPGPLSALQLKVYKDFHSMPMSSNRARLPAGLPPLNVGGTAAPTSPPQEPPPFLPAQSSTALTSSVTAGSSPSLGPPQGIGAFAATAPASGEATITTTIPAGRTDDMGATAGSVVDVAVEDATRLSVGEAGRSGEASMTLPPDVQATLTMLLGSVDQAVQDLMASLPLLPPIDCANAQLYKHDDGLDASLALSQLPLDHNLVTVIRQAPRHITQCSQPDVCSLELARRIFKRLYEAPHTVPQVHPPDTISPLHAIIEIYVSLLEKVPKNHFTQALTTWVDDVSGAQRYNLDIISGLLRYDLLVVSNFDRMLAKWIETRPRDSHGVMNASAVDFAVMLLQRVCLRQRVISFQELNTTVEALRAESTRSRNHSQLGKLEVSPQEAQLADAAAKIVEELYGAEALPAPAERQRHMLGARLDERTAEDEERRRAQAAQLPTEQAKASKEAAITIFEEWRLASSAAPEGAGSGGQACAAVLQRITAAGLVSSEEAAERFFGICCEHAVLQTRPDASAVQEQRDSSRAEDGLPQTPSADSDQQSALNFSHVDSFTRLIVAFMKCAEKVQMLTCALSAISKALVRDCERREYECGSGANQRPYFRAFLNILTDVSAPDPNFEQANFQIMGAFANALHTCSPLKVPSFTFAWLELVSSRLFMPKLLKVKGQRGWLMFQRLLVQLLYFLEPYLRRAQLDEGTRLLYKGTVRVLLVLLHDFPEFLCDYHFSFCDIIPVPCVQIRNLVLSAFPRNMKLPDPFMPNLKVDLLPEIKIAPRILANYTTTLLQLHLKADVDSYMRTREKWLLETIKDKLRLPKSEAHNLDTRCNVPLLNALLLYVGVHLPQHGKSLPGQGNLQQNNPSLEIFMYLAHHLDHESRYLFLSAIANHLRYPNTHTHYFSCVLLYLFADTNDEVVREQITRVLLERLIVHRPHPWGLLITFVELIKNRRYAFWTRSFVACAPEVEKLFQSVAYTCLGTSERQGESGPEQQQQQPVTGGVQSTAIA